MRIPLGIRMYGGGLRLLTSANVKSRLARLTRWTDLVLDTGSPDSMIGYKDALLLQIRITALNQKDRERVNMGAKPLWGYKSEAEYVFKGTNGEEYQISLPIKILTPYDSSEVHTKAAQAVPSILGLDFLRHANVRSISKDPETNEFYIEIK